jgi:hypothetical protein
MSTPSGVPLDAETTEVAPHSLESAPVQPAVCIALRRRATERGIVWTECSTIRLL